MININSNIRLHYLPFEKLKTTVTGVYIHRPLCKEEASYNALLPYVLKRGCTLCPDTEKMSEYLENLYGAAIRAGVPKTGEDQTIYFEADVINDRYSPENEQLLLKATELLLSVLFNPILENGVFGRDFVEQEKKVAIEHAEAIKNDKRTYAMIRCREEMCAGERFAVSEFGTVDEISKITPKSLYEHYKKIITSSVIDIYVCGECDEECIKELVLRKTDGMVFTEAHIPQTEISKPKASPDKVVEKMDVAQGKMAIGFKTGISPDSKEYPALRVMNSIFGAGAHSKLFNNVREKLSLAYYASSSLTASKGLLIVNAGIEFKNFEKAYDESLLQLESIKNGDISDEEFSSSVSAIINSFESLRDDQRALQRYYNSNAVLGIETDIEEDKKAVLRVTKKDASEAAKKLILDTVYFLAGKEEA